MQGENGSGNITDSVANSTALAIPVHHMQKIFLQTSAAQGIAGAFSFAALILTCWQVKSVVWSLVNCDNECLQQTALLVSFIGV